MSEHHKMLQERVAPLWDDPLLRWYAAILSLVHALVGVAWFTDRNFDVLVASKQAICWPLMPECQGLREHYTQHAAFVALCVYVGLGVLSAVLFVRSRCALRWPRSCSPRSSGAVPSTRSITGCASTRSTC